jgi:hypothetical protein
MGDHDHPGDGQKIGLVMIDDMRSLGVSRERLDGGILWRSRFWWEMRGVRGLELRLFGVCHTKFHSMVFSILVESGGRKSDLAGTSPALVTKILVS